MNEIIHDKLPLRDNIVSESNRKL